MKILGPVSVSEHKLGDKHFYIFGGNTPQT